MLKGNVEIAAPAVSKIKKYAPRLQVLDLPFLFVSPDAANNFLPGPYGDRMLRLVERHGLLGLGFLNNGMKQLSTKTSAKVPTDINGLRFRIMNSDVLETQFKQVAAEPMHKSFGKVYELLKTNEIDGQENTWSNIYSKEFYKLQENIIESNHGYLGYMVMTNKQFWNNLSKEYQFILGLSLKDAMRSVWQLYEDQIGSELILAAAYSR